MKKEQIFKYISYCNIEILKTKFLKLLPLQMIGLYIIIIFIYKLKLMQGVYICKKV